MSFGAFKMGGEPTVSLSLFAMAFFIMDWKTIQIVVTVVEKPFFLASSILRLNHDLSNLLQ
jgi:hypothetical protein